MKTLHSLLIVLLISFAATRSLATTDGYTELLEDVPVEVNLSLGNLSYFKYTYIKAGTEVEIYDLSIDATPLDGFSDPDLYVTKNIPLVESNLSSANYSDISFGYDIVVIPKEDISERDTFYIAAYCSSPKCRFRLNVLKTGSYNMTSNQVIRLTYRETAEEIVRISIPPSTAENPITRIIITAELKNSYMIDEPFHMYVDKGEKPPQSTRHDISAENAWFEGKAAVIYKNDAFFCTNCTYTVLLQAQNGTILQLSVLIYGHDVKISLGETRYDAVEYDQNITYSLNLTNQNLGNNTLIISFTPYTGSASLQAHPQRLPKGNESYYWSTNTIDNQELVITAEERKEAGLKDLLYITVVGIRSTTFQLKVTSEAKGTSQLRLGTIEIGSAVKDEVINYLLPISSKIESEVKLTITEISGVSDAFVKSCSSKIGCTISKSEIQDYKNGKQNGLQGTNSLSGRESVSFNHTPSVCASRGFFDLIRRLKPECIYAVAVINSGNTSRTRYNLKVNIPESITQLPESTPLRGHVRINGDDYYSFTVAEEMNSTEIVVQVTSISGEVEVFISKTERYPSLETSEIAMSFMNSFVIDKESTKDKHLAGTYYINVHGVEVSTYSIIAYFRPSSNEQPSDDMRSIELSEGVTQYFEVEPKSSLLFSFSVSLFSQVKREIDIVLQSYGGRYTMYASNEDMIPTKDNYQFKSDTGQLKLTKKDSNFRLEGTYYVRVYENDTITNSISRFGIMYATSNYIVTMRMRESFMIYLDSKGKRYYRLEIDNEEESIRLSNSDESGQVEMYISYNSSNPFPSSDNADFVMSKGVRTGHISKKYIDQACNSSAEHKELGQGVRCFIFITISTESDTPAYFSLTASSDGDYQHLPEGIVATISVPQKTPTHLYFIPKSSESPTEIIFTAISFDLRVYASLINRKVHPRIQKWTWPTNTSYSYSTLHGLRAIPTYRLEIPPKDLEVCTEDGELQCALAITVVNQGPNTNANTNNSDSGTTFPSIPIEPPAFSEYMTVIATSLIVPLQLGRPMLSFVAYEEHKYFQIRVLKPNCTILISVSPLTDGDPALVVSYGAHARPSFVLGNAEFTSSMFKGERLEISNDDILPRLSMEGVWTIGVYGFSDCSFVITVVYEENKIMPLYEGIPADFQLEAGKIQYFSWRNYIYDEFKVIVSDEEGQVVARINPMSEDEDILDALPRYFSTWASNSSNNAFGREIILISNKTDPKNFCGNCEYIIGVAAKTRARGFVVIALPNRPITLQDGRPLRYVVEKNKYEIFQYMNFALDSKTDITMIIYSGEPEIYVSNNENVSRTSYNWSAIPSQGQKIVQLSLSSPKSPQNPDNNTNNTPTRPFLPIFGYYIAVYGREPSSYLIMATKEDSSVYLSEGTMSPAFIGQGEYQIFEFNCWTAYPFSNQRLKFYINVHNDQFTAVENLTEQEIRHLPVVNLVYDNQKLGIEQQKYSVAILRNNTIFGDLWGSVRNQQVLQVAEVVGLYTLNISNPYNHSLNISVVANRIDTIRIPIGTTFTSRVGVGEIEVYEIYVNQSGTLSIKAVSCFGAVRFSAATSTDKILNHDFDLEVRHSQDTSIALGTLSVIEPGVVYIGVQGTEGLIDDVQDPIREALYNFEIQMLSNYTAAPGEFFSAGGNGFIELSIQELENQTSRVNLTWTRVDFGAKESHNARFFTEFDITAEYTVVLAKDPVFSWSYSMCSYLPLELSQAIGRDPWVYEFSKSLEEDLHLNAKTRPKLSHSLKLETNSTYYATVKALVRGSKRGVQVWEVPISYEAQIINLKISKPPNKNFIIGLIVVCGIGLIGILFGACWLLFKYKKLRGDYRYAAMNSETSEESGSQVARSRRAPLFEMTGGNH